MTSGDTAKHSFYFLISEDPYDPTQRKTRVSELEGAAKDSGVSCNIEEYEDLTTVQVKTDDAEAAVLFKLLADVAVDEWHK